MSPDLHFIHHGSLVVMHALTPAGREWVAENIPPEAMTWGRGTVIEPRYVDDIADGADACGLICAWTLQ